MCNTPAGGGGPVAAPHAAAAGGGAAGGGPPRAPLPASHILTVGASSLYLGPVTDLRSSSYAHVLCLLGRADASEQFDAACLLSEPGATLMTYHHCDLKDRADAVESLEGELSSCVEFIYRGWSMGGSILVHCRMGISRSATVVAAFLMYMWLHHRDDLPQIAAGDIKDASTLRKSVMVFLKGKREVVHPNHGFKEALKAYAAQVWRDSAQQ